MPSITILNDPLATGGTVPQGVNDSGEIVGYYIDAQGSHGFTYSNGSFTTAPSNVVTAEGVNDAGQVVGSTSSDTVHPFGINTAGQVVGSFTGTAGTTQSFMTNNGSSTQLSFPGAISTFARGINDQGQVVGSWTGTDGAFPGLTISHGFFYENGTWSTLDASGGVNGTFAEGINNSDLIVGYYVDASGISHGLTFDKSAGAFTSVDMQGATNTYLYGINNLGEKVGAFIDGNGNTYGFSVSPSPDIAVFDTTRSVSFLPITDQYSGPVAGLDQEYIYPGHDSVNMTVSSHDWFLKGGAGDDAIQAFAGYNVLDGGTGSNFLTGGSGTDTFFVDDRGPPADIWSTVTGFHMLDDATIFGIVPAANNSNFQWVDNQGAAGFTGLTLHVLQPNAPTASLTLAGYTTADLSNGRLNVGFGTEPDGTPFMHVIGTG
jgi:probable HAF family extracellular repeat protein